MDPLTITVPPVVHPVPTRVVVGIVAVHPNGRIHNVTLNISPREWATLSFAELGQRHLERAFAALRTPQV